MEEVLLRRGVAYVVVGSVRFYERKEIKDALAYLRVMVNPADQVSIKRIINEPKRGIGDTTIAHIDRFAQGERIGFMEALRAAQRIPQLTARAQRQVAEFVGLLDVMAMKADVGGVAAAVESVLHDTGYMATLEAEKTIEALGRAENLKELLSVVSEFETGNEGAVIAGEPWDQMTNLRRLELFLERVSLVNETDDIEEGGGALTMMTLHNAKGLEFPVVFMVGMEDGVFPHLRTLGDPDELEEERRLCYVGITRSQDRLFLTSATSRMLFGATNYNPSSRFLKEIPPALIEKAGKRLRDSTTEGGGNHATLQAVDIVRGDRVLHDKWGVGTVREVIGVGNRAEAEVVFDEVGKKRLLLAWAPLTKEQ
jgi:DNA helicase-2/ATP-dependent DNA helicase PcrA